ncbi:hypothetical protein REC12_12185 [Desulfosporosinus sp. PR]|uniref:hypothetical protein n=1 Tax=Candidatus Desulfosporosinus nitrosoreducens TaxID=3401928 RepID=UPI0027ECF3F1|nr:hypothetical protein [Desulfosporosinus sp. PR]MDQ7094349.1 hypothetical protein [Desulfosporosinus sp. PR]
MLIKFESEKGLFKILYKFFSLVTFILAVSAFFNIENWLLRIFVQGGLGFMMIFMGLDTISRRKEEGILGYLTIGAGALAFLVMINTIVVAFKIGVF